MSLEEALEKNTAALTRLADLIERYTATCEGREALPVAARIGDSRDAAAETKLAVAVEKVATEPAEVTASKVDVRHEDQVPKATMAEDSMVFAPGEEIPELTWEGVTKQFRKYAQKHGRDGAVKLAEEFGLTIPLNKDALTPDRYEDFYYACSN